MRCHSRAHTLKLIMVLALGGLGTLATPCGAATFGTPLGTDPFAGSPENTFDCTQYPTSIAGPLPVYNPEQTGLASSCIWLDSSISHPSWVFAPSVANATVQQVRVAVGPSTGQMQVVVMRSLFQQTTNPGRPFYACCTPVARSQPFTPQPNAITTVAVNLPMHQDPTPPPDDLRTIAANDVLGLAVLEAGVPVPLYSTGDPTMSDFLWNTATPSTVVPGFYSDTAGFAVAMDADWIPAGAGALARRASGAGTASVLLRHATQLPLGLSLDPGPPVARGCQPWGPLCVAP